MSGCNSSRQGQILRRLAIKKQSGLHCEEFQKTHSNDCASKGDIAMKRITAIALAALASFITVGSISAQERSVRAAVPFDFTVGNKLIPAGTYTVSSESANVVLIQSGDRHITVMSTAFADSRQPKHSMLVFNRYGDQYFLHEILCSSGAMNLQLPTSKVEKRVQTQEASLSSGNQILVALK
jgi:hypothetical protein